MASGKVLVPENTNCEILRNLLAIEKGLTSSNLRTWQEYLQLRRDTDGLNYQELHLTTGGNSEVTEFDNYNFHNWKSAVIADHNAGSSLRNPNIDNVYDRIQTFAAAPLRCFSQRNIWSYVRDGLIYQSKRNNIECNYCSYQLCPSHYRLNSDQLLDRHLASSPNCEYAQIRQQLFGHSDVVTDQLFAWDDNRYASFQLLPTPAEAKRLAGSGFTCIAHVRCDRCEVTERFSGNRTFAGLWYFHEITCPFYSVLKETFNTNSGLFLRKFD